MINSFTKVCINVEVKDFPVGKILKMHFWIDKIIPKENVENYIKDKIVFNDDFYKKYTVNKYYINKVYYTCGMSSKEEVGKLILDSTINATIKTNAKNSNSITKEKKVSFKDIKLYEIDTIDLKDYINTINEELFKRENKLSDQEFDFYKYVKDIVEIKNIKKIYSDYNGDVVSFRKNKIREKLKTVQ